MREFFVYLVIGEQVFLESTLFYESQRVRRKCTKVKNKGQLVQKREWKGRRTDGRTDGHDRSHYLTYVLANDAAACTIRVHNRQRLENGASHINEYD